MGHPAGERPSPVRRERVAEGRERDRELAIERGLEAARTLVLCLSPAALGSDWVGQERSTVLFRDPANTGSCLCTHSFLATVSDDTKREILIWHLIQLKLPTADFAKSSRKEQRQS